MQEKIQLMTMQLTNQPKSYSATKLDEPFSIDNLWNKKPWKGIEPLELDHYMGTEPFHRPKVQVKVAYDEDEISQISFTSHQQNIFYTSESEGILSVDTATGKISSYQVRGTQKVWFLPTNKIEVKGEVIA